MMMKIGIQFFFLVAVMCGVCFGRKEAQRGLQDERPSPEERARLLAIWHAEEERDRKRQAEGGTWTLDGEVAKPADEHTKNWHKARQAEGYDHDNGWANSHERGERKWAEYQWSIGNTDYEPKSGQYLADNFQENMRLWTKDQYASQAGRPWENLPQLNRNQNGNQVSGQAPLTGGAAQRRQPRPQSKAAKGGGFWPFRQVGAGKPQQPLPSWQKALAQQHTMPKHGSSKEVWVR